MSACAAVTELDIYSADGIVFGPLLSRQLLASAEETQVEIPSLVRTPQQLLEQKRPARSMPLLRETNGARNHPGELPMLAQLCR